MKNVIRVAERFKKGLYARKTLHVATVGALVALTACMYSVYHRRHCSVRFEESMPLGGNRLISIIEGGLCIIRLW